MFVFPCIMINYVISYLILFIPNFSSSEIPKILLGKVCLIGRRRNHHSCKKVLEKNSVIVFLIQAMLSKS